MLCRPRWACLPSYFFPCGLGCCVCLLRIAVTVWGLRWCNFCSANNCFFFMIRDPNWWRTIFFNLGKKPTNHKHITRNFTNSNWQWISVATFSSWSIFQSYLFDHFAFQKFWGTAGWWLVSHTHWKTHLWILEFHSNIWPTLNLGTGEPGNPNLSCTFNTIPFPYSRGHKQSHWK